MKTVWNKHTGSAETAYESPREPGVYLLPKDTVEVPPPKASENELPVWKDGGWQLVPDYRGKQYWFYTEDGIPISDWVKEIGPLPEGASLEELPEKPKTYEEQLADMESQRLEAYQRESDPIFFRWQRGEATEQEWKDKIAEIKERYPKPEVNV